MAVQGGEGLAGIVEQAQQTVVGEGVEGIEGQEVGVGSGQEVAGQHRQGGAQPPHLPGGHQAADPGPGVEAAQDRRRRRAGGQQVEVDGQAAAHAGHHRGGGQAAGRDRAGQGQGGGHRRP